MRSHCLFRVLMFEVRQREKSEINSGRSGIRGSMSCVFTERGSIYGIGLLADWFCALSDHRGSHYGIDDDPGLLEGALAAFLLSLFHVSLEIQLLGFVIVGILCFLFYRPFCHKMFVWTDLTRTNTDSLIGERGQVTEEINNQKGTGLCWQVVRSGQPETRMRKPVIHRIPW